MIRSLLLCAAALLGACSASIADGPDQWREVAIEVRRVELGVEQVGQLRFRGGVEIASGDPVFGGLSGIEVLEDNRIIAINDKGEWFEARLVLDDEGALTGVAGMRTAAMRDESGRVFRTKEEGDSEDVAQLPDGRFAVSFEQTQTIRIYDLNRDGPFGAAVAGPVLARTGALRENVGLEAIAAAANGAVLVGAEGGDEPTTGLWIAQVEAQGPPPGPWTGYPLAPGFSLTSLDRLPDGGGFVALERFYAPVIGARARITRFPDESLRETGEVMPGVEELAVLAPPMLVDNFEGVATQRMPDGATRIYIVSDDNFSRRQRTLLYAFDVVPSPSSPPR